MSYIYSYILTGNFLIQSVKRGMIIMEKLQKKFQKTGLYQPDAAGKRGPFIQMLKKYI